MDFDSIEGWQECVGTSMATAAHHAAAVETRREVTRLRSFKRLLLGQAVDKLKG